METVHLERGEHDGRRSRTWNAERQQRHQAAPGAGKERTRERVPLDWAATQNNLGNALRSLGERQKDVTVVCEALGAHLAAWEVFGAGDASRYAATTAKGGVERDVASLRDAFEESEYERCLAQHRERLQALRNAEM